MAKRSKKRSSKKRGGVRGGGKYKGGNYVLKGRKKLYGAAAAAHLRKHGRAKKRTKTRSSR
jgi:hypothetical protein